MKMRFTENNPTEDIIDRAYKVAIRTSIAASKHALKYWPSLTNPYFEENRIMKIFDKANGVGNYVTIADIESEEMIMDEIKTDPILKYHNIAAEESSCISMGSEYRWIVDPID